MHKVVGSIAVAAGALFLQGCNSDDKKKCELKYQQLQSDGKTCGGLVCFGDKSNDVDCSALAGSTDKPDTGVQCVTADGNIASGTESGTCKSYDPSASGNSPIGYPCGGKTSGCSVQCHKMGIKASTSIPDVYCFTKGKDLVTKENPVEGTCQSGATMKNCNAVQTYDHASNSCVAVPCSGDDAAKTCSDLAENATCSNGTCQLPNEEEALRL